MYDQEKYQETDAFAQKLHSMYDKIETEYRPDVRWWLAEGLNTDKTLEKNVQEIYDSGFGAAEFLAMPEPGADSSVMAGDLRNGQMTPCTLSGLRQSWGWVFL